LLPPGGLKFGPFFSLILTRNTGGVFGVLPGHGHIFTAVGLIIGIGAAVWAWMSAGTSKLLDLCLAFVMAGALGNLADRLVLGYVRDFLDLGFWPAFNVADACLTTSAVLLGLWASIVSRKRAQTGGGTHSLT
jgi:signal peptidase II